MAPRWLSAFPLGGVVLLPAAVAVAWLQLGASLLPEPVWLLAAGLPLGWALLALSTALTVKGGARRRATLVLVAIGAPMKARPPARRVLRSLAAATGEELLFRLLGLWLLGDGLAGVVVTTVAFALAHLLPAKKGRAARAVADAALCGAALAWAYIASGGLAVVVIAHFVRNLSLDALRLAVAEARHRGESEAASPSAAAEDLR